MEFSPDDRNTFLTYLKRELDGPPGKDRNIIFRWIDIFENGGEPTMEDIDWLACYMEGLASNLIGSSPGILK